MAHVVMAQMEKLVKITHPYLIFGNPKRQNSNTENLPIYLFSHLLLP